MIVSSATPLLASRAPCDHGEHGRWEDATPPRDARHPSSAARRRLLRQWVPQGLWSARQCSARLGPLLVCGARGTAAREGEPPPRPATWATHPLVSSHAVFRRHPPPNRFHSEPQAPLLLHPARHHRVGRVPGGGGG